LAKSLKKMDCTTKKDSYPAADKAKTGTRRIATEANRRIMVEEACRYMKAHLPQAISVADVARAVYCSPFHFSRIFRQHTRMSPAQYLIEMRLQKARFLLITSKMPVHEIAAATGFASPAYFSLLFKRRNKLTPQYYRRRYSGIIFPFAIGHIPVLSNDGDQVGAHPCASETD
jgi:transcriptional regulator GlxA family with amidase domain